MDYKEQLANLRGKIDAIDDEMVELFKKRMAISVEVADVKASGNIAVLDEGREQQVLNKATQNATDEDKSEIMTFMRNVMSLSRLRQSKTLKLADSIDFPEPQGAKDDDITVAYQGVAGAWGQHAAIQLFPNATKNNYDYFEDVFGAVKAGKADYGVLPIENSQTGAIGEVYDLLKRYNCYIVGQVSITVAQCLLAGNGATLDSIREIFSHSEGFNQSRGFLKNKNWELTTCRNTAYAAQMVAEKNSPKYAAIGSRMAAEIHGLSVLMPDIMDNSNNKTRFIAISAKPEYDSSSNITSITFSTAHKSGALCAVLECFMLAGINMSRIESRPTTTEKYRFFVDLQCNVLSDTTLDALKLAATHCDYFEVLGCYHTTQETSPIKKS